MGAITHLHTFEYASVTPPSAFPHPLHLQLAGRPGRRPPRLADQHAHLARLHRHGRAHSAHGETHGDGSSLTYLSGMDWMCMHTTHCGEWRTGSFRSPRPGTRS
eukprot:1993781-Pleurochrysis_carterae.AAC.1